MGYLFTKHNQSTLSYNDINLRFHIATEKQVM